MIFLPQTEDSDASLHFRNGLHFRKVTIRDWMGHGSRIMSNKQSKRWLIFIWVANGITPIISMVQANGLFRSAHSVREDILDMG